MNDYFDALERELTAAVPRAARSHRRRSIARLPLFRLSSLWLLLLVPITLALAPAAGLNEATVHARGAVSRHHAPGASLGHRQTRRRRAPRQPNEFTLLKGLEALRRRTTAALPEAQLLAAKVHAIAPLPAAMLLRFAAASTALGVRTVLVVSRRRAEARSSAPPARSAPVHLILVDPRRCGGRRHEAVPARRVAQGTATCAHAAAGRCDYTRLVARSGLSRRVGT